MLEQKLTDSQRRTFAVAALAAPIAHVASGISWPITLLTVLLAGALRAFRRDFGEEVKRTVWEKWLCRILCLTAGAEIMTWMAGCWPKQKDIQWVMLILLGMAVILCRKGRNQTVQAGILLWWFVAFLFGSILLSAIQNIHLRFLGAFPDSGQWEKPVRLLILLLLPSVTENEERQYAEPGSELGILALLFSGITQGVLSQKVAGGETAPFYELSRSVRFYGTFERMEALAWLGLMLGTFLSLAYILSRDRKEEKMQKKTDWLLYLETAGIVILYALTGDRLILVTCIGVIIVGCILPGMMSAAAGKKKLQKNEKT